jgi:hypothetical protein
MVAIGRAVLKSCEQISPWSPSMGTLKHSVNRWVSTFEPKFEENVVDLIWRCLIGAKAKIA